MATAPGYSTSQRLQSSGRVPVLLIATAGRSGSTLLDRVIGTQAGFCSCGELRFIWERSYSENQLCGCGQAFHDCPFWDRVSQEAFGVSSAAFDPTRAIALRRAIDEVRRAPRLVLAPQSGRPGTDIAEYVELLDRLYPAILRTAGASVIVDSSGDSTHGLILARSETVDLHVVHLVRDARAVAFSWKRVRRRPEIHWREEDMPIEGTASSSRLWMAHNCLAELLARRAASYHRLRYEDFVADPSGSLSRVLVSCGQPATGPRFGDEGIVLTPAHTVSGNPMRFKQGRISIRLDDEWRSAMARRDRWLATALTVPLLARYGYLSS